LVTSTTSPLKRGSPPVSLNLAMPSEVATEAMALYSSGFSPSPLFAGPFSMAIYATVVTEAGHTHPQAFENPPPLIHKHLKTISSALHYQKIKDISIT
jgi:hypothetical protein